MSKRSPQSASNLQEAMAAMSFELLEERFALCGFEEAPGPADLALIDDGLGQLIREGGETSLLIPMDRLPALIEAHPSAKVECDLVWIRFQAAMGWEVVGFLAKVTSALAAEDVPLGALCGFSRDHLFIHQRYLSTSLLVLQALFPSPSPS
jgi:hypothetical protein